MVSPEKEAAYPEVNANHNYNKSETENIQGNFVPEISLQGSTSTEHAYFTQDANGVVALISDINDTNNIETVVYNNLPHLNQINLHTDSNNSIQVSTGGTGIASNIILQPGTNDESNTGPKNQSLLVHPQVVTVANDVAVSSPMVQFPDMGNIVLTAIETHDTSVQPNNVSMNLSNMEPNIEIVSTRLQVGVQHSTAKYFCLQTLEDVEETIRKHTEETFSHFVVAKKTKAYGSTAEVIDVSSKFRIHWQSRDLTSTEECAVQMPFDGIPYIYIGEKAFMCHLGRSKASKNKPLANEITVMPDQPKKHRSRLTKKQGCPAKIFVKQIAKFPQFSINANSEYLRTQMSQRLRKALVTSDGDIHHIIHFIGTLPDITEHLNHDIGENTPVREPIDPVIRDKIVEFTWECGENAYPREIKQRLDHFVENVLFKGKSAPSKNRRRYYPSEKDISNYIYKCRMISKLSINEQDQLHMLTERLQHDHPDSKISFRIENDEHSTITIDVNGMNDANPPQINHTITPEMRLLFAYQTINQQRLLKRYGKQAVLTEISQNTTKLPFPIYGVYVPTNVDFQLVYLFIVQARNGRSVKDGLSYLSEWNPYWTPKFFVVDFCQDQINAIDALFPGSIVHISDESRDLNWDTWLNDPVNMEGVIGNKEEVLARLLSIANAYTEETLNKAAQDLENSEVWRMSERLRDWFSTEWLAEAKRWVVGYHHDEFFSTFHFDVSLTDELSYLRDAHYNHLRSKKLSDFMKSLVEDLIPACYQRYVDRNIDDYRKQFAASKTPAEYPSYLQNKPSCIANYILTQIKQAKLCNYTVNQVQPGIFWIQEKEQEITYAMSFGDIQTLPSCVCVDWLKYRLPCQHLVSVFLNYRTWSWDMLSTLYTGNACFNIDFSCFDKYQEDLYLSTKDEEKILEENLKVVKTITIPQIQLPPCPSSSTRNITLIKPLMNTNIIPYVTSYGNLKRNQQQNQNINLSPHTKGLNSLSLTNDNKASNMMIQFPSNNMNLSQSKENDLNIPTLTSTSTSFNSNIVTPTTSELQLSTSSHLALQTQQQDLHFVTNLATDCDTFCQELSNTIHQVDNQNMLQKVKLDLQLMLNDVKLELSKVPTKSNKRKDLSQTSNTDSNSKKSRPDDLDVTCSEYIDTSITSASSSLIDQPELSCEIIKNHNEWIFDNELNIKLNKTDQENILNGHHLTSVIIKTVQIILRHQFEDVAGLLDPSKITTMSHVIKEQLESDRSKKIIQIHKGDEQHWSTSAKIGENIFIFCCTLTSKAQIIEQILQMTPENSMGDNILFIERMEDSKEIINCGLYSIAYAVAFAFDIEPRNLIFDENGMRSHLAECLEDMCFSMFPLKSA